MKNQQILEGLLSLINEELDNLLMDDEDEALRMSDERRKIFKKTVFSNPASYNSAGTLKEAPEDLPPVGDDNPTDAPADGTGPEAAGDALGAGEEMSNAGVPGSTEMGNGAPPGAEAGMPGGDDPGADLGGDDMGGGGGGLGGLGGGMGGGGGGGGLGDIGGESGEGAPETAETAPEPSYDPFKDTDSLDDRLQVILDTAEALANQTQDPQKIVKSLKGLIQNGFENPEQAAKIIADLFDTDNPVLQQVSRRLALFTLGI